MRKLKKMSSKSENGTTPLAQRLCHVVKQDNFDGYGFNLHAEKGKPGQYIGKVDEGSPAESAGLKQGDRILEVNGSSILNETHKQVVQRIKAIAHEVQLLVIDPAASPLPPTKDTKESKSADITTPTKEKESGSMNGSPMKTIDSPDGVQKSPHSSPISNHELKFESPVINVKIDEPVTKMPDTDNNKKSSIETEPVSNDKHNSNSIPSSPKSNNNSTAIPSVSSTSAPAASTPSGTSNNNNTSSSNSAKEGLNLNMTAAELRAKLAAKKKFDPKNESVDLRKKFEIIQKL